MIVIVAETLGFQPFLGNQPHEMTATFTANTKNLSPTRETTRIVSPPFSWEPQLPIGSLEICFLDLQIWVRLTTVWPLTGWSTRGGECKTERLLESRTL